MKDLSFPRYDSRFKIIRTSFVGGGGVQVVNHQSG